MSLSRTLLPTPAGPRRMRVSAGATEKLTFSITGGPSKPTATLCNATTGSPSGAGGGSSGTETVAWLMWETG